MSLNECPASFRNVGILIARSAFATPFRTAAVCSPVQSMGMDGFMQQVTSLPERPWRGNQEHDCDHCNSRAATADSSKEQELIRQAV